MNVYEAIMKAADSIELEPKLFDFYSSALANPDCGTPACAIGWIATHAKLGVPFDDPVYGHVLSWGAEPALVEKFMGASDVQFYSRMDELHAGWRSNPAICARTLRAYAEKYHGHENRKLPVGIPDSVRKIFEPIAA